MKLLLNEIAAKEENVTLNEVATRETAPAKVVEEKIISTAEENTVHDEIGTATAQNIPKIFTDRKNAFPEYPDSIIINHRNQAEWDDGRLRISLEIDPVQWFKAKLSEFWEGPGSPSPEDEVNAVYFHSLRHLLDNCDNYISQERQKEYAEQENMTKETGDSTCSDCKFRKSGKPKMLVQCKKHLKTFGNTWTPCRWRQESSNIIYSSVDGFFQLVLYSTFEQRCIVTVNPESLTCPVHTDEDVEQSVEFWNFVFECMDHIKSCCGASVPYLMMNRGSWESERRRQKNYIMNCHAHVHLVLPAAVTKIKIFESFTGSVDFSRKQNVDDLENEIARYRRQLSRLEDLRLQKDINWLKDDMKEMKKEIVTVKDDMKEMKQKMTSLEINISKILKHLKIE
ncbi:hypothetical protein O9G_003752 [Rozella allomycis CSF55]|uniref:Uncharacterized protein n=1 Tax=Rozella allomycis (strain CSF55) TaxID=988480 RepID=A0A075AV82_ROZAC|nr:hypothetical protein O9G_003752 [Rozella allomycis CSF55]|eukprot:EPZ34153.1 hypothetical protein O9G_003752 [Rozella allomycis CSF55]